MRVAPHADDLIALPRLSPNAFAGPLVTVSSANLVKGLKHDAHILVGALRGYGLTCVAEQHDREASGELSLRVIARLGRSNKLRAIGLRRLPVLMARSRVRVQRLLGRAPREVNIFLETLDLRAATRGSYSLFVPNPEWLRDSSAWIVPTIDRVLCKTHHAVEIFSDMNRATEYLGFTSLDYHQPGIQPERWSWVHCASAGAQKNTDLILKLWQRHPEWPHLTVVGGLKAKSLACVPQQSNLTIIREWLGLKHLASLLRKSGVHVCPSSAEGFGHTLAEGLGVGAVVITTDFPPMNELVDPKRGVLVPVSGTRPMRYGTEGIVTDEALEDAIERTINLSDAEWQARACAARAWFIENERAFHARLATLARELKLL